MFQVSLLTEMIIHFIIWSYNGKTYVNHPDTTHDHHFTSLGDIDNKVLVVGSNSANGNQVEIFDIVTNRWTTKTQFPFGPRLVWNEILKELALNQNFRLAFIDMQ